MNSRVRFNETMTYGSTDRVPYFHEGMQADVIAEWRRQGLPSNADVHSIFSFDAREEVEPDLEPHFGLRRWPCSRPDLKRLKKALDPMGRGRLPKGWNSLICGLVIVWRRGRSKSSSSPHRSPDPFYLAAWRSGTIKAWPVDHLTGKGRYHRLNRGRKSGVQNRVNKRRDRPETVGLPSSKTPVELSVSLQGGSRRGRS